eukprot:m.242838 g.242838  ORF g.242838 m.242838 type:complete len:884 (+) comp40228_c1_seq2:320-2971(+)
MINNGDIPESLKAKLHYQRAVRSGSVPVIRSRLVVVGPDGAGKTSFIGSLLGRKFKEDRPSTDGVAIEIAVTEADDKWKEESCDGLRYFDKQIARATAFQIEQPEEIPVRADTARVDRKSSTEEPNYTVPATKSISFPADIGMRPSTSSFRRFLQSFQRKKSLSLKNSQAESSQEKQETVTERRSEGKTQRQLPEIPNKALPVDVGLSKRQEKILSSNATMVLLKYLRTKHIWDLGGQETYLATHAALMSLEGTFTVTAYALVFDLSKSLNELAQSHFRDSDGRVRDLSKDLGFIRQYGDFLRHWLTSFRIAYPSRTRTHFLGENEGIEFPPVFGVATRADEGEAIAMLPAQRRAFAEIFKEMDYEGHLVKSEKDGQGGLFLISNSLSSDCPGIQEFRRRLDAMDKDYWSKQRRMPTRWLAFEKKLITWKDGKVMNLRTAMEIASKHCAILSSNEVIVALQYLHNLGVIQYFQSVPSLREKIFVDPVWLVKAIAAFVTSKEPSQQRFLPDWRDLKNFGEMSPKLTNYCLQTTGSTHPAEQETVLNALEMIDIAYQSSSEKGGRLFIPCMIKRKSPGYTICETYNAAGNLPPPIVVQPEGVPAIPEAFYFRLIVHFLRKFSGLGEPELSRSRCSFFVGPDIKLELLYHPRGQCIVVAIGGSFEESSLIQLGKLNEAREFLLESMKKAKQMGMMGLRCKVSCHLEDFTAPGGSKDLCVKPERLICLDGYHPDGERNLSMSGGRLPSKEEKQTIKLWFGRREESTRRAQIMSCREAQELAKKVKNSGCFPSSTGFSECPDDIIHIVCQSSVDLSILKGHLGISSSDLSRRPKQETEYGKARDIIDVWIGKQGREATLDVLFDAVEKSGVFGTVRESVKQVISERQK